MAGTFDGILADKNMIEEADEKIGGIALEDKAAAFLWNTLKKPASVASVSTDYASEYVSPTDKVSNIVFNFFSNKKNTFLYEKCGAPIDLKGKKAIRVCLTFNEANASKAFSDEDKLITMYDRLIYDAVVTLYQYGNEYMTPQMIYHVITGDENSRVSLQSKGEIKRSILKMMFTCIQFNMQKSEQFAGEYAGFSLDSFQYIGPLISAEIVEANINNNLVECIHLLQEPVLYTYAKGKKQVIRTPIEYFQTPLNKNKGSLILQNFLLRRILILGHPKNRMTETSGITYDDIYKHLGIPMDVPETGALKKKKTDIRKKVKILLDFWKNSGVIKDYTIEKKGKKLHKVVTTLKGKIVT